MALTVWLKAGHTVEVINRERESFTQATGLEVDLAVVPEGEAHDRLLAGERPDVVTVPHWYLDELIERDLLRALDGEPWEPALGGAIFEPAAVAALTRRGRWWAVPHTLTGGVVSYRADLVDGAGLEQPETTADVLRVARTLGTGDGPMYGLVARASSEFSSLETYCGWAWSRGVKLVPDAGRPEPDRVQAGVADLVAVLRDTAPHDLWTRDYAAVGQLVADGQAAVLFDTSAWAFFFEDARNSQVVGRMRYTTVAGPAGPAQFLYAEGLGITASSLQPQAAAQFIAWRHSEEVLRREVTDLGRVDLPRRDIGQTEWFDRTLAQRHLRDYMDVVRQSWAQADMSHVPARSDYVAVARRTMAAISGVLRGRYPSLDVAVAAMFPPAGHAE